MLNRHKPHQFNMKFDLRDVNIRLGAVAVLGAGIGFLTYEVLYFLVRLEPRATIAWTLSFLIGVLRQHYLHQKLTFKLKTAPSGSLVRAYAMYSMSIVLGTTVNYIFVELLGIHHRLAWLFCLALTASISLIFLKRWVFQVE